MLNKNDESGHLSLVPVFRGKAFNFSPLTMTLAADLSKMTFIISRYVPTIPTLMRVFVMNQS